MKFSWWASQDGDHYTINEDTREAVIEVARNDFDGNPFYIVEASQDAVYSMPDAETLWEQFVEMNEDLGGEDIYFGEDVNLTDEQMTDLTEGFRAFFTGWMEKNAISPAVFKFTATRNEEVIPGTDQDPDAARDDRDELARLAKENTDD